MPDYEIERKFWPDEYYEGGDLFHDTMIIELIPPADEAAEWIVRLDWQNDKLDPDSHPLDPKKLKGGKVELSILFDSETTPDITGQLRFIVSEWTVR